MKIKSIITIVIFLIGSSTLMGCATNRNMGGYETASREQGLSYDVFYSALSPYGRWITYPQYGRVWIPEVGHGFQPYATNGHWVYSNYGWTWVSNYSWGWAPFHYGRWAFDDFYGWVWIPGTTWAPAWVAWRSSPGYFGWAPLGPGMAYGDYGGIPTSYWVFVPSRYITSRNIHRYYEPRHQNGQFLHNTQVIYNNQNYPKGPTRRAVQQATNEPVRPVRVFNADKPEDTRLADDQLRIYRPNVETNASQKPAEEANSSNRPRRVFNSNQQNSNVQQNSREVRRPTKNQTRPRSRVQDNNRNRKVAPQTNSSRPQRVMENRSSESRRQSTVSPPAQTDRSSQNRPRRSH